MTSGNGNHEKEILIEEEKQLTLKNIRKSTRIIDIENLS